MMRQIFFFKGNGIVIFFVAFFFSVTWLQGKEAMAEYIFGVTIDDPWTQRDDIYAALSGHALKPTVRIVFDEWIAASEYRIPVDNIASAAFVMGEILDSSYVKNYTVQQYLDRTEEYLEEFENDVDIWEIGNEVNGNWLGATADVVEKIEGAYTAVKNRGLTAAINFYYNKSCLYNQPEYEMFTWINANISEKMKNGLDYVFFSYYEDDCDGVEYTAAEWQEVFDALHAIFPNAKLGFGEVGTEAPDRKAEYMRRYYSFNIKGDYFVGGCFWWYYRQDCVPKTEPLWNVLNSLIQTRNHERAWLPSILLMLL
ncbi:MAG: hypothetical protein D3906_06585 [Candidatus Electrothrix sp. AUS1_2]|nr:hypothetical protein [Candidatus Electrothrix sp. AUS1_2]